MSNYCSEKMVGKVCVDELVRKVFYCYLKKCEELQGLPELTDIVLSSISSKLTEKVKQEILEVIEQEQGGCQSDGNINIEGFVEFRAECFKEELNNTILQTIRFCLVQEQYFHFLEVVKHYVMLNPCNVNEFHVTEHYLEEDNADSTLDMLIELLPEKIVFPNIHAYPNQNFIDSVKYIFGDRVEFLN